MKSTAQAQAIEIISNINTWATSSYAHLCNREGYPRGYREGIAFSHETVAEMLGENVADLISALNEESVELGNLREENETLRADNRNLDEMRDNACRCANRANMEILELQKENRRLLIELGKIKLIHGLELTADEKAAIITALSTNQK